MDTNKLRNMASEILTELYIRELEDELQGRIYYNASDSLIELAKLMEATT